MALESKKFPTFGELPLRKGDPPFSAWGLWENSQLGALNHLTDDMVLRTTKEEIQTGKRVGLNLPLDFIKPALLGRTDFEKKIINKAPRIINDDVISFNTQGSSQWDSFRHFAFQPEAKFYNGVTQEDIHGDSKSSINGLDAWASRGIAGRGVFIDYFDWATENGIKYNPVSTYAVPLDHIKKIISEKDLTIRTGDIFILRTGYVHGYSKLNAQSREDIKESRDFPGLGQSKEVTEWLWQCQFSAVAADSPGFECNPPSDPKWSLHPILLAGWGTPIGELFDLEALSNVCKSLKRWTFFLSSAPLNFPGAVASPPNVIAFF